MIPVYRSLTEPPPREVKCNGVSKLGRMPWSAIRLSNGTGVISGDDASTC
jgi:hypothetical protein